MSDDSDPLKKAIESIRIGVSGILKGLYYLFFGFGDIVDNQNIYIKSAIQGGIYVLISQILSMVANTFLATIWGPAVYISGIRLRLIPIPLSLIIYLIIFAFLLFRYSMKSQIRDLQSEITELKSELDGLKEDTDRIKE